MFKGASGITACELSGSKMKIQIESLVHVSMLSGLAAVGQKATICELSSETHTEHPSVAKFKLNGNCYEEDMLTLSDNLPSDGWMVKLFHIWSDLSVNLECDGIRLLELVDLQTDNSDFITKGWVFIKDINDDSELKKTLQEWADIQSSKVKKLQDFLASLSDDEFQSIETESMLKSLPLL